MLKIAKNQIKQDEATSGKARLDKAAPGQGGVPWFWKKVYILRPQTSCVFFFLLNLFLTDANVVGQQ